MLQVQPDVAALVNGNLKTEEDLLREQAAGALYGKWQIRNLSHAYEKRAPLKFLVDGILPYPCLAVVYGGPGSLKSMLLADMAVCVASGQRWLEATDDDGIMPGRTFAVTQAPVLWIDFDNGTRRTDERIDAFAKMRNLPVTTPLNYVSMPTPWLNASQRPMVEELAKLINSMGARLVIIDNLGLVTGDVEENSAGMAQVMGNLRYLCEITESAVIIVHHQRKSSGADNGTRKGETLRGHSSIEAALDLALLVERKPNEDSVAVIPTKVRGYKLVDIFGAHFTYTHLPGSYDLETARFFSAATESAIEKELRLIKNAIQQEIITAGKPLNQKDLVDAVRDTMASKTESAPGINKVRGILKDMVRDKEIYEFSAEKGKANRAQFYDLTTRGKSGPDFRSHSPSDYE